MKRLSLEDLDHDSYEWACYMGEDIEELKEELLKGVSLAQRELWGLTVEEWKRQVERAIKALRNDGY